MEQIALDWSTAEVEVQDGTHVLTVRLAGEASGHWMNAFTEIELAMRRQRDWVVNAPTSATFGELKLTVHGVRPGLEDAVRAALDQMVTDANVAANKTRKDADAKRASDLAEAEQRENEARGMTERFRRPG